MSALSRELANRGRADAVAVVADAPEPNPEPSPEADESEETVALRSELATMRLMALHKRALSEGVSADAVEDAMDGDDPKSLLVALILEVASSRGPTDGVVSAIEAGG